MNKCQSCLCLFNYTNGHSRQRYCSHRCRQRAYRGRRGFVQKRMPFCMFCSELMPLAMRSARYCTHTCRQKAYLQRQLGAAFPD